MPAPRSSTAPPTPICRGRCATWARSSTPRPFIRAVRRGTHLRWLAESNDISLARVDAVLDLVGLTAVADKRAGKFSLGMGQRLGIASALLGDPGVLLFDEPVNGLDPEGIRWVRHLLRDLAAEGRTVLVSSHLINEMALTAERLVVIGRGTLIAETSVDDFVARHQSEAVRIVTPTPQRFVAALSRVGARPMVERRRRRLSPRDCPPPTSATWPPTRH